MKFAFVLAVVLVASAAIALMLGPAGGRGWDPVVVHLRLPRVLAALVTGAGLAVAGVGMQALLRNPIADPYILGLSSGASLGAVLSQLAFVAPPIALSAGLGALAAAILVAAIARDRNGLFPPTRLILAGVSVAAVLSSLTAFALAVAPREASVRAALYFSAGGFSGTRLPGVAFAAVVVALVLAATWRGAWALDRLLLGQETAESLGVDTARTKLALLVGTTLLIGALVTLAGPIGFVGLIAPHVARLAGGATHRALLPMAVLCGALLVLWADTLGRTLFAPRDIPAGMLTAALGGPAFLWLLSRRTYAYGGTG